MSTALASSEPPSQAPSTAVYSPRVNSLLLAAYPWDTDSLTVPVLADVFQGSNTSNKLLKRLATSMDLFENRFANRLIVGDPGLRQHLRIEGAGTESSNPATSSANALCLAIAFWMLAQNSRQAIHSSDSPASQTPAFLN
ncbi:hypothetical protein GALMADRAFT_148814 [Galerina marginata CBS 339.88]|uniref:Uncharacterized protein n=1 Tax=Galerina marginata (strain CBS 339.88) TaxID=685588 RepID=A0A067SBY9_GALM3|nr:hypothetical protein GALMADRAFT_148814 [Galerina marginata CBS 339.88]